MDKLPRIPRKMTLRDYEALLIGLLLASLMGIIFLLGFEAGNAKANAADELRTSRFTVTCENGDALAQR